MAIPSGVSPAFVHSKAIVICVVPSSDELPEADELLDETDAEEDDDADCELLADDWLDSGLDDDDGEEDEDNPCELEELKP
jgi:hypothetical protein